MKKFILQHYESALESDHQTIRTWLPRCFKKIAHLFPEASPVHDFLKSLEDDLLEAAENMKHFLSFSR